ncbi:hypothetical protein [Nocardioides sp. 503]|uniref:hypothetical protein n=1 Tax=Nocardioides sp. 503 TaxID=2508326 RepID=UPI0010705510|nr:hypothetical protein [Nocardioides sp. 503]
MSIRAGLGVLATLAAATVASVASVAPAHADSTVTVRGTAFPDARAQLGFVGCGSLFARTAEPVQPRIGRAPGLAPAGQRSLGFDLAGGNAMGGLFSVASVTRTVTAGMTVHAPVGATGVAYAGYRSPADAGTSLAWFGRATVTAAAGIWQNVDATLLSYVWTQYDLATGRVVTPASTAPATTVRTFAAAHGGDGPGLFTVGFGCDGQPFSMDALRSGTAGDVTTYDVEGLATSTEMVGDRTTVEAGESVELHGVLNVEGGVVPHATLLLEELPAGAQRWTTVAVVDADDAHVTVTPTTRTSYRWRFVDRPLAEASESLTYVVDVAAPAAQTPAPAPSATPTPRSTPSPKPAPAPKPTPTPAAPSVTPTPSSAPSATPPTPSVTATPGATPASD